MDERGADIERVELDVAAAWPDAAETEAWRQAAKEAAPRSYRRWRATHRPWIAVYGIRLVTPTGPTGPTGEMCMIRSFQYR